MQELIEKLRDAMEPDLVVTLEPHEAQQAGAFLEDALSVEDALTSSVDLMLVDEVP